MKEVFLLLERHEEWENPRPLGVFSSYALAKGTIDKARVFDVDYCWYFEIERMEIDPTVKFEAYA